VIASPPPKPPAPLQRSAMDRLALPTEVGAARTPLWAWVTLCGGFALTVLIAWAVWQTGPHPVPGLAPGDQISHVMPGFVRLFWVVCVGCVTSVIGFHVTASFTTPINKPDAVEDVVDSSHMADLDEMRKAGLIDAKCGRILGYVLDEKTGDEILLRWPSELGIEAIGRQESGKTASLVKPGLLMRTEHEEAKTWSADARRAHPYGFEPLRIVLAVKPDLVDSSAGFQESLGHNVVVLDPFSTDPNAAKYDPLHLIRVGTRYMFGDCFRFGLSMIDQGAGLQTFWDRTAHEAVGAIIGHCAFVSLRENDPTILSLPWLYEFLNSFHDVIALCNHILKYEHDPHGVFGWTERKHGKNTNKKTKTCPWITSPIRSLRGAAEKAPPQAQGIISSVVQFLAIYGDPILAANVSTSTFNIKDMANDPERASTIYIRMPAADLDRCRPYVRMLFNTFFYELLRKTTTRNGREMRGNLREVEWEVDEGAQLNRMEDIERYAGLMRGLGGKINLYWQNKNQIIKTYGRDDTIRSNLGVHAYFRPELLEEAKPLSEELGQFSFEMQHRNLSGDRMALMKNQLSEQNQIQTRAHFTPSEVKSLGEDEVLIFCKGLHIRAKQFRYFENEAMLRRSQIPWSGKSAVTVKVPFCITNLEQEIGAEKLALLGARVPDLIAEHLEAAQLLENGCRVASWAETDEDTGVRLYFLQFWLPEPARFPIVDTSFPSYKDRAKALKEAVKVFDDRDKPPAPPAEPKAKKEKKPTVDPAEMESAIAQLSMSDLL
jgi:type IV secretory pathway TraG/TraD family ATPase VirD4